MAQLLSESNGAPSSPSSFKIQFAVIAYMCCSSTMLIINKVAVYLFPLPTTLLSIQLFVSAMLLFVLGNVGIIQVDPLRWNKIKDYFGVVLVFLANIFTNIKALQYSNVETVIVFRTCTSLAVAYGDYRFLKKGAPSMKMIVALCVMVLGAIGYVFTDSSFRIDSYFWVSAYFCCQCLDVLYIKHITDCVPMTTWGRSYYNNVLAFPITFAAMFFLQENQQVMELFQAGQLTRLTAITVFLSCIMGLLISASGFLCRELTSATSYSVIGNMNKIITVIINQIIWDHHASQLGLCALLVCLAGGAFYTKFKDSHTTTVTVAPLPTP